MDKASSSDTAASEPPARRRGLDRQRITRAAVELLDEVGLAELSTRRLATRLGVRSPTLYWHIRDKDELLDLIAEAICADAFDIDETLPWRDRLATGLRQFRTLLLSHRDAATLLRMRPPNGPNRMAHIETTMRILLGAGFSETETAEISLLLSNHALDSVEEEARRAASPEAPPPQSFIDVLQAYPSLRRVAPAYARLSGEDLFERGIEIMLDGLAHHVRDRPEESTDP